MKPFNNWNDVKAPAARESLPEGGYICVIKDAEVKKTQSGYEMLVVSFDIAEGEYKDFYTNDYRAQQGENKYWGGVIRYFLPREDGTENDNYTKSRFRAFTNALEDSNPGYHWDWDETALKEKKIGMITRNEEWEWNDKSGFKVRPFMFIDIDRIRDNKFSLPKTKYINGGQPAAQAQTQTDFTVIDDDDDLPFN